MAAVRSYQARRVLPRQSRRANRGQALAFTLVLTVAAGLVSLLLFNSGMLANTKSQLQNAADAAAYSAATLQARDHNFSAYTNRAMIANQVAVAQFVSLKSYLQDAGSTHNRMRNAAHRIQSFIPVAKPAWDVGRNVPVGTARAAMDQLAPVAVKGLDALIKSMETAQQVHHVGTMAEMMVVADEVARKNDPAAGVSKSAFMLGDATLRVKNWGLDSTKQHSANDASREADRFADAVLHDQSQDGFIRNRTSVPVPAWANPVKPSLCIGAVASFTAYGFYHGGGTILSTSKKRWLGLDATMGGGFASCTWLVPCPSGVCPVTITTPLFDVNTRSPYVGGHGGAVAGSNGRYGQTRGYKNNHRSSNLYGFALTSPASVPAWLKYRAGPGASLDTNGGLQDYYRDVANPADAATQPKDQTPEENGGKYFITVEVERTVDSLRLSSRLLPDAQRIRLDDAAKGNVLRTVSSAHAYFYRPKADSSAFTRSGWARGDGRTELANLFNPYWQARLIDTPAAEALASAAAQ